MIKINKLQEKGFATLTLRDYVFVTIYRNCWLVTLGWFIVHWVYQNTRLFEQDLGGRQTKKLIEIQIWRLKFHCFFGECDCHQQLLGGRAPFMFQLYPIGYAGQPRVF